MAAGAPNPTNQKQPVKPSSFSSGWKSCVPKCGGKEKRQRADSYTDPNHETVITCLHCRTTQSIPSNSCSFVCSNCNKVNRIHLNISTGVRRLSFVIDMATHETFRLARLGSTTFGDEDQPASYKISQIPQCSVCMDGPGDMILLPCSHGGICEACAKHIAKNMSVGGAQCPKCREPIVKLVRISEVTPEGKIRGIGVEVPQEEVRRGPPRVPPPVGSIKAKDK